MRHSVCEFTAGLLAAGQDEQHTNHKKSMFAHNNKCYLYHWYIFILNYHLVHLADGQTDRIKDLTYDKNAQTCKFNLNFLKNSWPIMSLSCQSPWIFCQEWISQVNIHLAAHQIVPRHRKLWTPNIFLITLPFISKYASARMEIGARVNFNNSTANPASPSIKGGQFNSAWHWKADVGDAQHWDTIPCTQITSMVLIKVSS